MKTGLSPFLYFNPGFASMATGARFARTVADSAAVACRVAAAPFETKNTFARL